ncbi:Chaperone protein dnaJ 50 [Raphanus sativus]|nr:Chaperone protein dnaJ 50 [Raphanus sativus]
MAPPAKERWCWALIIVLLSLFVQSSTAIYCGEDDCYALLGVAQDANASDIKRSYYKLSLEHHPDKNPDPESKKLFVKIATAYEVFYNTAQYYRAKYGHKSDPRAVLVGLLALATVKRTPAYKNRLKALELERTGGVSSKKKGPKQIDQKLQEELSNELDLQIKGAENHQSGIFSVFDSFSSLTLSSRFHVFEECPHYSDSRFYFSTSLIQLHVSVQLLVWYSSWVWRYKVKKAPYSWEDASYLTRRSLGVPLDAWTNLDEYKKEDLVQRRLWEKQNLENYYAEMRKESKRRR